MLHSSVEYIKPIIGTACDDCLDSYRECNSGLEG